MNKDQISSLIRSLITMFGGVIAGWFAAKGYLTYDQVIAILNSETFLGLVTSAITTVLGIFAHTQIAKLNAVAAMPEVKQVVVTSSALARETPSPKVTNGQ